MNIFGGDSQSQVNGRNVLTEAGGQNVDLTLTTSQTVFTDPQELITKAYADSSGSSSNIVNGVGTDNAIVRFDTNGNTLQNSNVLISDTGNILGIQGTSIAPSYSFNGDTTTGIYRPAASSISFSTVGVERLNINGGGIRVGSVNNNAFSPAFTWISDTDTGMYSSAANNLDFTTGGTQRLNISSSGIDIKNNKILNSSTTLFNTAFGTSALNSITTGQNNIAIGYQALQNNQTRDNLIAIGSNALRSLTTGIGNLSIGYNALTNITTQDNNVAIGLEAGKDSTAYNCVYIGSNSGRLNNENSNVHVGSYAGDNNVAGYNNVMIGYVCRNLSGAGYSSSVGIGASCIIRASNEVVLGNESTTNLWRSGRDGNVNLGSSSYRFNTVYATNGTINTSDLNEKIILGDSIGLDELLKLKTVKYRWKDTSDRFDDDGNIIEKGLKYSRDHYGIIAQDVETLIKKNELPDSGLFVKSAIDSDTNMEINLKNLKDGDRIKKYTYGLRYTELIAPLVKAVQELNNRIKILESKI